MYSKKQNNGVCNHNSAYRRSGESVKSIYKRNSESVKECYSTFLTVFIGIICGILLVNWCKVNVTSHCAVHGVCCKEIRPLQAKSVLEINSGAHTAALASNRRDNFIFVGIMTAKKFIDNRGLAAHRTWASNINGKVMFFSSEGSSSSYGVPVVALPGVDDHYPPQKKSFMMMKYMYDHFLDKFEWFMRADDDVFIKGDKLDAFLRGINSSQPLFVGQAGTGKPDELGKLALSAEENFCMGGPGMIFSRETLRRMAPHISYCLRNLYTSHEDVEIGRCVRKFAGVQCTWSYEMQHILYQNYKEAAGSFKNTLKSKEVQEAITLHPVKDPDYQYRIFNYLQSMKIMQEHQREVQLHRDYAAMTDLIEDEKFPLDPGLSQFPSLMKFHPLNGNEVIAWEFMTRSIYSQFRSNPRMGLAEAQKGALDELINQILIKLNKGAYLKGRIIDFKEIKYAYQRINPLNGADYILDMLLLYKKYRGKRVNMNVRRHAYLQQAFLQVEMKEDTVVTEQVSSGVGGKVKSLVQFFVGSDSSSSTTVSKRGQHIDIIMPLMGRFTIFQRFMNNIEEVIFKPKTSARLIIVLYKAKDDLSAHKRTLDLIYEFQWKYGKNYLEVVQTNSEFSRGPGLQLGIERCSSEALLFLTDVDIIFTASSLEKIRLNTLKGSQVYFPIVFSQYDPEPVCSVSPQHCKCMDSECYLKDDDVSDAAGYWRQFGFGIAAMYRSDYHRVGGFDLNIRGWGKEDVDLYTKFIDRNYIIFRSVDPNMIHIFHNITCSDSLEIAQYIMCINSKAQSYASSALLTNQIYKSPRIMRRLEVHYIDTDAESKQNLT